MSDKTKIEEKSRAADAVGLNELLAADLKKGITNILANALAGYKDDYKTKDGCIRWGLVERDIHKLIDSKLSG